MVERFANPVFEAAAAKKQHNHRLAGYVGEWLWYLLTRDLPQDPARVVEFLGPRETRGAGRRAASLRLAESVPFTAEHAVDTMGTGGERRLSRASAA
ncbi:hypothetical protein [Streptomyces rubrogriseus]|uniref:hypothetical protein n=1 Tax=Streptomyces rubrogriseus TaxID=194673 RepID=UPI0037B7E032